MRSFIGLKEIKALEQGLDLTTFKLSFNPGLLGF